MSCEYCDFNIHRPQKDWEIELYVGTSYKYEGKKYFLEVSYPSIGELPYGVKPVEVNYCPKCGRKLGV